MTWNQKNLDYEIETRWIPLKSVKRFPWNQKNLDYEIETYVRLPQWATSIKSWNQKNLDYEIETCQVDIWTCREQCSSWNQKNLDYEIETWFMPVSLSPTGSSWNQKNLDYEIETNNGVFHTDENQPTWNQKNLDYEIETTLQKHVGDCIAIHLKSKEPRLRDWNVR